MAVISIKNKTKSGSLLVGNSAYNPPAYESIATTTVSTSVSSVTFSSIPSTYTHLQLRWIARSDRAATQDFVDIRLNSDTGANYAAHLLYGDGAAASAAAYVSNTSVGLVFMPAASSTGSVFGVGVMDILDYTNTNKYTTTRVLGGADINGSGRIVLGSGVWMNTAAVTTLTIITDNASTYTQYSKFALYGIKG
jgi:hypothetical protein